MSRVMHTSASQLFSRKSRLHLSFLITSYTRSKNVIHPFGEILHFHATSEETQLLKLPKIADLLNL